MQNGPSPTADLLLALGAAAPAELQRLLAHLGELTMHVEDEDLLPRLLWYLQHQPRRLQLARRAHRANDPLPALMVFSDDERALRGDASPSVLGFAAGSPSAAQLPTGRALHDGVLADMSPERSPDSLESVSELPRSPGHPPGSQPRAGPVPAIAAAHAGATVLTGVPLSASPGHAGGVTAVLAPPPAAAAGADLMAMLDQRFTALEAARAADRAAADRDRAALRAARDADRADRDRDRAESAAHIARLEAEIADQRSSLADLELGMRDKLQRFLLDVDTVLPKHSDPKTVKAARSFRLEEHIVSALQDHGIVPACGFNFHAENHVDLMCSPDELQKLELSMPRPSNVLDPAKVDKRTYDAFSGRFKSRFDAARSKQLQLNAHYENLLFLAYMAVDDELSDAEKLAGILKSLGQLSRHLLHQFAVAERERLTCTGTVYNDDPSFTLPDLNWGGDRALVTDAVASLFAAQHAFREGRVAVREVSARAAALQPGARQPGKRTPGKRGQPRKQGTPGSRRPTSAGRSRSPAATRATSRPRSSGRGSTRSSPDRTPQPNGDTSAAKDRRASNASNDAAATRAANGNDSDATNSTAQGKRGKGGKKGGRAPR
eukprot:SAG11_NODE_616_length_8192_cov_9.386136_2_plen_607_part_00